MTQRKPNEPPAKLESLEPVNALKPIRPIVLDDVHAFDTHETVRSSDRMGFREANVVIDLDYDEDVPTRVDGKRRQARRDSPFPLARTDADNLYYITDEVRPSRTEEAVNPRRELCTIPDGPKVKPPSEREAILPADAQRSKVPSIVPVEMQTAEAVKHAGPTLPGRRWVGTYGGAVSLLVAVAVTVAMWPTDNAPEPVVSPPATTADVVKTVEAETFAEAPTPVTLDEILIVARVPRVHAAKRNEVIALPHSSQNESRLHDTEQPGGKVGLGMESLNPTAIPAKTEFAPLDEPSGRRQR